MTGGDPDELDRAARGGPGQAWTLAHTAGGLDQLDAVRRWRGGRHLTGVAEVVTGLRRLGDRFAALDRWVEWVAAALRAADAAGPSLGLLGLGVGHPASHLASGVQVRWDDLRPALLTDRQLADLAAVRHLPGSARDAVQRERLARWVGRLDQRVAAAPRRPDRSLLDRLARWVDERLVDRLSPVTDLHVSHAEHTARLRAEADGARRLLAEPGLTIWSFDPDGPALRVALGDPATARQLAVLLPGTATGLHAVDDPLQDAGALHGQRRDRAVVLDLYAAPPDLGRAADPAPGRAAGASTASFLVGLPPGEQRITLVGHSYGAFTAAQAARAAQPGSLDALVLLGAPGAGVASVDELPLPEVWAGRLPGDPIGVVADLDEHLRRLPPSWVPGPLADPLAALGPDPTDPEFGARSLDDLPADGAVVPGHLDYLTPGTASLARVTAVVAGLTSGSPPRQGRPASAAAG